MISREQALKRIAELLVRIDDLTPGRIRVVSNNWHIQSFADAAGVMVAARSFAGHLLQSDAPYHRMLNSLSLVSDDITTAYNQTVLLRTRGVLLNIREEIEQGLLGSFASGIQASIFDDFLDHGKAFLDADRKNEAGAIAGIVFEDTIRKLCLKHGIEDVDKELDTLISALARANVLNGLEAKRSRVCAHLRNQAAHAKWDQFDASAVKEVIEFLRTTLIPRLAS